MLVRSPEIIIDVATLAGNHYGCYCYQREINTNFASDKKIRSLKLLQLEQLEYHEYMEFTKGFLNVLAGVLRI